MEAEVPLRLGRFDVADRLPHLGNRRIVARHHHHRDVVVPRDGGVPGSLGDVDAVQRHFRQVRAREGVCSHPRGVVRSRVVADEDGRVDLLVDARHHAEPSWPRTDDADVGGELLDEKVLTIPV